MSDNPDFKFSDIQSTYVRDAAELSEDERKEFDYLDWNAIQEGSDSASFARINGEVYDLGEFQTTRTLPEFNRLRIWDGYLSDSFFSGILIRFIGEDYDEIQFCKYYC